MKKVQVYRNLHRTEEDGTHVYSVRNDKGIVEDHVTEITLSRPILRVGPKGNQRVRDEKRKNVHAYIQGMKMKESLIDDYGTGIELCEWQKITYNPYLHKSFVLESDQSVAVREAWFIEIRRDGVWAYLPEPSTTGELYKKQLTITKKQCLIRTVKAIIEIELGNEAFGNTAAERLFEMQNVTDKLIDNAGKMMAVDVGDFVTAQDHNGNTVARMDIKED